MWVTMSTYWRDSRLRRLISFRVRYGSFTESLNFRWSSKHYMPNIDNRNLHDTIIVYSQDHHNISLFHNLLKSFLKIRQKCGTPQVKLGSPITPSHCYQVWLEMSRTGSMKFFLVNSTILVLSPSLNANIPLQLHIIFWTFFSGILTLLLQQTQISFL